MMEVSLGLTSLGLVVLAFLWWRTSNVLRGQRDQWALLSQGCPDVLWHWNQRRGRFSATDRVWDWVAPPPGGIQELFEHRYQWIHPDDLGKILVVARQFLDAEIQVLDLEFRMKLSGPSFRWYRVRGQRTGARHPGDMAGSLSDVTEVKALGAQLWEWSHIDPMTRLANRHFLLEHLSSLEGQCCLILIDIDHFTTVNEVFKQAGGDQVLRWVARTLSSLFRSEDFVARWGGDEFAVVLAGPLELAQNGATRIHRAMGEPTEFPLASRRLSVSIGIVTVSAPEVDAQSLVSEAEQALQQAKKAGGQQTIVFSQALGAEVQRKVTLEIRLAQAIENGALRMVYQPQFRTSDRTLTGFEALARWTDPELGPVSPAEFIPHAESLGLISRLGFWALEQACGFLSAQSAWVQDAVTVSVNVSVLQLREEAFADRAEAIVLSSGLHPRSIELEITETILIQSFEEAIQVISRLRDKGFRIALDDFGKGYSSLSYLKIMPLDSLKIDKTFLDDETHRDLLGSIIQMGQVLHLQVIAEGIEEEHQLGFLLETGCHKVQGFLFSAPLEVAEAQSLIDTQMSVH